jgi:threonine dehydrogenase-like Zn-dependent dehydrogenase
LKLEPNGVNRSCDCCGFECVNDDLKPQTDIIIRNAVGVTATGGGIGVIGVYLFEERSAGVPRADPNVKNISFPISDFWSKNLTIKGGAVDPKPLAPILVELVKSGRARPSFIVSSEIGTEEAEEGYKRFSAHRESKVVIRFPWRHERDSEDDAEELAEEAESEAMGNEPTANGYGDGGKRRKRRHEEL